MPSQYLHYSTDLLALYPNARVVSRIQPPFTVLIANQEGKAYLIVDQRSIYDESPIPISEMSEDALGRAIVVVECIDEDERFRVISMFRGEGELGEGGAGSAAGLWSPSPFEPGSNARILGKEYGSRDWK